MADSSSRSTSISGLLNREGALDDTDLAGFVADLRFHQHGLPIVVNRIDDWRVSLLDDVAADFPGPSNFAVVGVEFLVQADEPANLLSGGEGAVDVANGVSD